MREKDPTLREELLARATDYVMTHGLASMTLRTMAGAIGTTARVLVYHFRTKETLVADVLVEVERRLLDRLKGLMAGADDPVVAIERMWELFASGELDTILRSAYEVWGLALVRPGDYSHFLDGVFSAWALEIALAFERQGLGRTRSGALATLTVAAVHGLLLNRLTTGDADSSRQAFGELSGWLRQQIASSAGRRSSPDSDGRKR